MHAMHVAKSMRRPLTSQCMADASGDRAWLLSWGNAPDGMNTGHTPRRYCSISMNKTYMPLELLRSIEINQVQGCHAGWDPCAGTAPARLRPALQEISDDPRAIRKDTLQIYHGTCMSEYMGVGQCRLVGWRAGICGFPLPNLTRRLLSPGHSQQRPHPGPRT